MGAKVSAEMKHALFMVLQEGKAVKDSAKLAGVNVSSVYKALRRIESGGEPNAAGAARGNLSLDLPHFNAR